MRPDSGPASPKPPPDTLRILDRVLAAHGGRAAWESVRHIDAIVTLGGDALARRGLAGAVRGCRVRVHPYLQRVTVHDFIEPGQRGEWIPREALLHRPGAKNGPRRLLTPERVAGRLLASRWDPLDLLAFTGMAAWSLLCFPLLLDFPGVELVATEGDPVLGAAWRLGARFPPEMPMLGHEHWFHVDASGQLARHDYGFEPLSPVRLAATPIGGPHTTDGLRLYPRHVALPSLGRRTSRALPAQLVVEAQPVAVRRAAAAVLAAPCEEPLAPA